MALITKKLSGYNDLQSTAIDNTTKLVAISGSVIENKNIPLNEFVEDSLVSTSSIKPLSAKQGKTLQDTKAPIANPTFTGAVNGVTKAMVGLGNVDNTSDAQKVSSGPISTALDGKSPKSGPVFTTSAEVTANIASGDENGEYVFRIVNIYNSNE